MLAAELRGGRGAVAVEVDFQGRILAAGPEVPEVIGSGRVVVVTVGVIQVGVPVSVDAGVSGGGLQLGRGPALAIGSGAEDIGIPVAGGDGAAATIAVEPNQPADTGAPAAYAAGGVAGGDGAAAVLNPTSPPT